MVGMIWVIQVLHYPSLGKAGKLTFETENEAIYDALQSQHVDRIGNLLLAPWLIEGVTLLAILWIALFKSEYLTRLPTLINGAAMAVILAISGFWSAPAHGKLLDRFGADVYDGLMTANFVRTIAWTICGVMSVWSLVDLMKRNEIMNR